ncbi:hypothetical protein ACFL23_02585 [Patescibacteria group bacterium]
MPKRLVSNSNIGYVLKIIFPITEITISTGNKAYHKFFELYQH